MRRLREIATGAATTILLIVLYLPSIVWRELTRRDRVTAEVTNTATVEAHVHEPCSCGDSPSGDPHCRRCSVPLYAETPTCSEAMMPHEGPCEFAASKLQCAESTCDGPVMARTLGVTCEAHKR